MTRWSPGSPSQISAALWRRRALHVAIEAVVRDVERAVLEPLGLGQRAVSTLVGALNQ
jgi:hypothetical protein